MTLKFKMVPIVFDATQDILQHEPGTASFNGTVKAANCAVQGFNIRFANGDHPVHEMEISIDSVNHSGTNVTFVVRFGLRDSSGTFDDAYKGWVNVLVIADIQ
jgi:hypothetical protein